MERTCEIDPTRVQLLDEESNQHPHRDKRLAKGCTNLMYACQQGHTQDIVKELRTKPKTLYHRDHSNKSALHYCSGQRDLVAAASVALAAPELLESADEDGFTPLHLAVIQGNMALVNMLLANKADVNVLDNEGHSVVHWATVCGEVEALRSVLAAGADISTPDINGGSPLHYAAQMCGANYDGKSGQVSANLALEILTIILLHPKSDVSVVDKDSRQPLLWAASAGSARAVVALIKAGARVESSDKDGLTAIHCAASRGHTDCIDTLISLCGAPTDLIDTNGCTALHYAVTLGHADATALLIDLDADPNRQDRKGRTPAHCGCAKGQFETVKLLKERGRANMWLRNAKGDLPIHEAATSGRRELVQWLLEQKPRQVNVTSNDGRTILHIGAGNDNTDMCKMLLDYGADINSIYRTSRNVVMTPLDCSLQKGLRSTAKFLQLHGGLPASKLRLSGRNPNAINDQELVKPLHFSSNVGAESTAPTDRPTNDENKKRIVVYVKRSDSEDHSGDDTVLKRYHKCRTKCEHKHRQSHHATDKPNRHHHRHRRRHRYRLRTSSCETFATTDQHRHKADSSSDICRSKSNIEIRRRCKSRNKKDFSSGSEGSSSDSSSSSECECKHQRRERYKQRHRRERSFSRRKKSKGDTDSADVHSDGVCKKRHKKRPKPDDTSTEDIDNENEFNSKIKNQEQDDGTKKTTNINETESATEKGNKTKTASSIDHKLTETVVSKIDKKRPQSAKGSAGKARSDAGNTTDVENVPTLLANEDLIGKKVNFIEDVAASINTEHIIITKADVHVSSVQDSDNMSTPKAEVAVEKSVQPTEKNEKLADKDDGNLTDSTFTVESTKPENKTDSSTFKDNSEISTQPNVDMKDITTETNDSIHDSSPQEESTVVEDNASRILGTSLPVSNGEIAVDNEGPIAQIVPNLDAPKEEKEDVVSVEVKNESLVSQKGTNVAELQLPTAVDQEQPRKSSFTVLASDESVDLVEDFEAESASIIERRKSFKVLSSVERETNEDEEAEESYTTNDDDVEDLNDSSRQSVARSASAAAASDGSGRRKRLKKRAKQSVKQNAVDVANDMLDKSMHHQQSKDHDSGFEPSPRAMRTKIPSPRAVYTAVMPRKSTTGVVDGRSCSSRLEGRKPGDKYSVNMTTVTQSIQRNIKRYYMERKIFQHLLELKSLQIRSSKINESVLVKRAVDDYHKSTVAVGGVETPSGGSLRRYPYKDFTFKNFEIFLYETLKSLQKTGTYNFQNISDVYKEAERRLSPDYNRYEKALQCTTKTHRCLHAAHAYTGIPCAAYIPMMNHHTMPKYGFGPLKSAGVGSFYLPKICTKTSKDGSGNMDNRVSLELSHGNNKQLIALPSDKLDSNKRYYVTFTVKGKEDQQRQTHQSPNRNNEPSVSPSKNPNVVM